MAKIQIETAFRDLEDWPGRLLETRDGGTITTRTSQSFVFTHGNDSDFAGFRVAVTGKGLTYDSSGATGGTITALKIFDDQGNLLITFSNFANNAFAADFAQFFASFIGSPDPDVGPDSDGKVTWSMLMSGNDTVTAGNDSDWQSLVGLDAGNDHYTMGAGDDYVNGGMGNDTYSGGDGYDTLSYDETHYSDGLAMIRGVSVNFASGVVLDPWGGTDSFSGFEEVRGSRLNDSFTGDGDRNRFMGLRGRDTIDGGSDSYDSGGNRTEDYRDEVRYHRDYDLGGNRGIVVDLETSFANGSIRGTIRDGFGNIDTMIDIERVVGTRFNDTFVGSRNNNQFSGGEGKDSYSGEDGWDAINFGRWFTDDAPDGINVDLTRTSGQIINDGFGNTENATGIEAIYGSVSNDRIKGDADDNEFAGSEGTDTLTGGGGADYFTFSWEGELNQNDRITDFKSGTDKLAFDIYGFTGMTETVTLVNGRNATEARGTFIFDASNDTLYWDSDGTGAANKEAIVVLTGVARLAVGDFELWA
ncbi:Hemolysin-type calcium-binding repeat-containing protein [Gemmobacter aquatilis]|uniref:Hemolysin-type calcium-binding repeat-containing protein n=1 Tax=Gemmobacter aquatilis TaxID=933059 RepID=A0A1H8CTG9_9RHOB|nr:hypothetical protein [Gemmobacter aquatilis]SEM98172.1 Hemolysin-type calcium-binding repeat-containing protein [Gemmobacter aquatilis]